MHWPIRIKTQWYNTSVRLTFLFGVLFTAAVVALLGFIYWRTNIYLELQAKSALDATVRAYTQLDSKDVDDQIEYALAHDTRHILMLGLFDAKREPVAGNLNYVPNELRADGHFYRMPFDASLRRVLINVQRGNGGVYPLTTATKDKLVSDIALMRMERLQSGEWLIVGRDITQMSEAQHAIENALLGGGSIILLLGLIGGVIISRRPIRRINAIRDVASKIMLGDLSLRVPYANRHDELDMLAATVNRMLDEIARLLTEVKSVTDTIAHDLRTPLTRLRAILYRTLQQSEMGSPHYAMFERAVQETDLLLTRFRALLRIAEIENRQRRAGFTEVDLTDLMQQINELFLPLAAEKNIAFSIKLTGVCVVLADPDLLFEALSNLIDNAIKFTPREGHIELNLFEDNSGPVIEIKDTGPGVPINEREAIMKRFYRSDRDHHLPGFGLGLSIVNAIMLLHGFKLEFRDAQKGTHLSLYCWPHPIKA